MTPSGIVTLLTDFGLDDPFVGVMHGVILRGAPAARVVDLAHGIRAHDVAAAAFWLGRTFAYFPPGTVHVCVVDPGVGTDRPSVVVLALGHAFVGPDNGLFGELGVLDASARAFAIDGARLGLPEPSRTFHGRDVFAPIAAALASGRLAPEDVGAAHAALVPSPIPRAVIRGDRIDGAVVVVDRFGNLITNVAPPRPCTVVRVAGRALRIVAAYADGAPGEAVALVNAWGVIEIAVRDGDARATLGLGPGAAVHIS